MEQPSIWIETGHREHKLDLSNMPAVQALIRSRREVLELPADERAVWENLHAEERVSFQRGLSYSAAVKDAESAGLADLGAFTLRHKGYLEQSVNLDKDEAGVPHTFDAGLNGGNHWAGIDDNVVLYRLEDLSFALEGSDLDAAELQVAIDTQHSTSADPDARSSAQAILQRVTIAWNDRRDRRPLFATTHDEVASLLEVAGHDWPHVLRDELGLGQYNPQPGRPVTVLLMRYPVREVRQCKAAGHQAFCIPTVLDGALNPHFVPTPLPGPGAASSPWQMGRAINLAARSETEYENKMRAELVHSYVDYRPEHLARWGVISRPTRCDLAQLRGFHLSWLRLLTDRDAPNLPFDTDLSHV